MRGGVGRVVQNLIAAGIDGFEQKISALDAGSFSPAGAALKKIITAKRAIGSLPPGSVVHLHCGFRSWLYVSSDQDIKYIATVHGIVPPKGFAALRSKIELLLLSKRRVSIVAVSEHCKKTMENMATLCRSIAVIPNGVPGASARLPVRTDNSVSVGFVGDFSFNKGIHTFLEVARLLKHMQARFTVFGNGPESAMVAEAAQKGLIRWINGETRPARIYPQMDILVFPSQLEGPDSTGCPMVVLEAKSYGVPIVASKIPGVREIIEDGNDGVLIGSWEAREYAVAVERLITASEMRHALSAYAKEKWTSHFNADLMAERYLLLASSHS
jgi:glycosyltransferase involved in cell wall biosynthesis